MRVLKVLLLLLAVAACAPSYYQVPKKAYRQQVRTLGVVPILLDEGSTVLHPQRDQVLSLLRNGNQDKAARLVAMLRKGRAYFDVRLIDGEPQALWGQLAPQVALKGKAEHVYRSYHLNAQAVQALCRQGGVDALLVLIVNGSVDRERRWDRGALSGTFLETEFNDIEVAAQVVAPSGEPLWEAPKLAGAAFLPLQYPDFDEAYYNRSDQVRVKFITVEGVERRLGEGEKGPGSLPLIYEGLFEELRDLLDTGVINPFASSPGQEKSAPEGEKKR